MNMPDETAKITHLFYQKTNKILEGLVYISNMLKENSTRHTVSKVFYFADRNHLADFGSLIFDDTYIAMKAGPVPSIAYDLMKQSAGDYRMLIFEQSTVLGALKSLDKIAFRAIRDSNLDLFSRSEITCINKSIEFCNGKSFDELCDLSHDSAWEAADRNNDISLTSIIQDLDIENKDILEDFIHQKATSG